MDKKIGVILGLVALIALAAGLWGFSRGEGTPLGGSPVPTSTPTSTVATSTEIVTTSSTSGVSKVRIAVIKIEDGGASGPKIGCNDSVVLVERQVATTTQPLNASYKELFTWRAPNPPASGELYTVVPSTNLRFDRATVENGVARVYLTGNPGGLGGVCDTPRLPAQIERTALQFPTVTSVETYLNGSRFDWGAWARADATGQ